MRLAIAVVLLLAACGNKAAEQKAAAQGRIAIETPSPPAPADLGQGDNAGSTLAPGTTADPPTSRPDQTGGVDTPVTTSGAALGEP
jgi:hypothetical protein